MEKELINKAKKIKAFVSDVDGVMTDGSIIYDEDGKEYKVFNAKDGQGVVNLKNAGILTAVITARQNGTIQHRFENLGITKIYQGQKDKRAAFQSFLDEFKITADEVAYIGDDLPDICILEQAAIAACPNDAVDEVKKICNFICTKNGGRGAVRELCDFIYKNGNFEKK